MASIIKRGRTWRAMIVRRGQRVSASFDSQAEARDWATKAEAAIIAGERPAVETVPAGPKETISDLIDRYAREVSPTKRSHRWERIRAASMAKVPAFCVPVRTFGPVELAAWRDDRARTVSAATVNRDLNFLSAMFNHAIKEWRAPIAQNPVSLVKRPKAAAARKRRVSLLERAALIEAMGWDGVSRPDTCSQWTAVAFCLALETAMRKGEILSLTWRRIDFDKRYAHLIMTKNGDERFVPLSSAAIALLRIVGPGRLDDPVVHVRLTSLDQFFRRGREKVGLTDLRFHDSRREATTQLSKKLANVLELGAVTGHRSLTVLRDYYRPDPTDLAKKLG